MDDAWVEMFESTEVAPERPFLIPSSGFVIPFHDSQHPHRKGVVHSSGLRVLQRGVRVSLLVHGNVPLSLLL